MSTVKQPKFRILQHEISIGLFFYRTLTPDGACYLPVALNRDNLNCVQVNYDQGLC